MNTKNLMFSQNHLFFLTSSKGLVQINYKEVWVYKMLYKNCLKIIISFKTTDFYTRKTGSIKTKGHPLEEI